MFARADVFIHIKLLCKVSEDTGGGALWKMKWTDTVCAKWFMEAASDSPARAYHLECETFAFLGQIAPLEIVPTQQATDTINYLPVCSVVVFETALVSSSITHLLEGDIEILQIILDFLVLP